eukprot:Opistho-2@86567
MALRGHAESVIKNIVSEIITECKERGNDVSETLAAFVVKAVVLDPDNNFRVDENLTRSDVEVLKKLAVDKLTARGSASLDTIRLQVYFDTNYANPTDFVAEHSKVLRNKLQPILRDITDSRARTTSELEALYRKIVTYILLRSGMGSTTDMGVVREATAALESVLPQSELGTFLSLLKAEKEEQLEELTSIVSGIRLFNKNCGKGGQGIDDLPGILSNGVTLMAHTLQELLDGTLDLGSKYAALVDGGMAQLRANLINTRQHAVYLQQLQDDVTRSRQNLASLDDKFRERMQSLATLVKAKTAVPTDQVYPQFIALAHLWCGFQDEMILLNVRDALIPGMDEYTQTYRPEGMAPDLAAAIGSVVVPGAEGSDDEGEHTHARDRIDAASVRPLLAFYPEATPNYSRLPLEYKGFCAYTIAAKEGLLVPGAKEIGVLRYKENFFAFSSSAAAEAFSREPDRYIARVVDISKKCPELIHLLDLHRHMSVVNVDAKGDGSGTKRMVHVITKSDGGTQTDTHIVESHIDKKYDWNEWELRRKALRLVNLRNKATHSMQTDSSHFRRDNETQVFLPK